MAAVTWMASPGRTTRVFRVATAEAAATPRTGLVQRGVAPRMNRLLRAMDTSQAIENKYT